MINPIDSKPSFLSAIMFAVRILPNRRKIGPNSRAPLVGLSGALGRGDVRHCSTWDIAGEGNLPVAHRATITEIANRRRQEATQVRMGSAKTNAFLQR